MITAVMMAATMAAGQNAGNMVYEKMKTSRVIPGEPPAKTVNALQSNILTIEADGMINAVPDAQIAIFTITQIGKTAKETSELINARLDPIKAELIKLGIKQEDIVTDMISFVPKYETTMEKRRFTKTYSEVPSGFELKKNLHIKFSDHQLIDQIIIICAENEVYDLAKVEYIILDQEALKKQLREAMYKHISEKIAFYHKLTVQDEIKINFIQESQKEVYPIERYQSYSAYSSSSFEAIQKIDQEKPNKRVTVQSATKNNSVFYMPVTNKHFDLVLNPGVVEPTVQMTLKMKVSYTLPQTKKEEDKPVEKTVVKKEYILIKPDGQTTRLPIN